MFFFRPLFRIIITTFFLLLVFPPPLKSPWSFIAVGLMFAILIGTTIEEIIEKEKIEKLEKLMENKNDN